MTRLWLDALPDILKRGPVVLVSVAQVRGSAPREPGASMLVGADVLVDSIGGGRLEWQAIQEARRFLESAGPSRLLRYSLGATLGQCCGGVVWLVFEYLAPTRHDEWCKLRAALQAGRRFLREVQQDVSQLLPLVATTPMLPPRCKIASDLSGQISAFHYTEMLAELPMSVMLFGAGHVGAAIVAALQPNGVRIAWVDNRPGQLPTQTLPGVTCHAVESAEEALAMVEQAIPGSYFLVMTHSHDLDLQLCERIFRRRDFCYFGLIGSASKRGRFEHRLKARGVSEARLSEMTCPIGIAGITSKEPAAIAIAVAAQMLQVRDSLRALSRYAEQARAASHVPGGLSFPPADLS